MINGIAIIRRGLSFLHPSLGNESLGGESASRLKHILVIAGPSGSGKSTFRREFVEGRLPTTISDYLPPQATIWKLAAANEVSRNGLSWLLRAKHLNGGLVIEYDTMRVAVGSHKHYTDDPAMQAVIGAGATLTVVTLQPNWKVLVEQFLRRARANDHGWEKRRILIPFKRKLRTAIYRLAFARRDLILLKESQLKRLELYKSEDKLKKWTTRWETFLENLRRERVGVHLIYVVPESIQDRYPRFRLLRRV